MRLVTNVLGITEDFAFLASSANALPYGTITGDNGFPVVSSFSALSLNFFLRFTVTNTFPADKQPSPKEM